MLPSYTTGETCLAPTLLYHQDILACTPLCTPEAARDARRTSSMTYLP